jgi:hypothetical protein
MKQQIESLIEQKTFISKCFGLLNLLNVPSGRHICNRRIHSADKLYLGLPFVSERQHIAFQMSSLRDKGQNCG